jgi:hypothetical protein
MNDCEEVLRQAPPPMRYERGEPVKSVTRCQFRILQRLAAWERLSVGRHRNGSWQALDRKGYIGHPYPNFGGEAGYQATCWGLTDLGRKMLAARGKMPAVEKVSNGRNPIDDLTDLMNRGY